MAFDVQRAAVIELGTDPGSLEDYTCDVSFFGVTVGRATVTKSPSFGSPNTEQRAAARTAQVVMTFTTTPHTTTGLVALLRAALNTVAGEVYFRVRYNEGAVSASNPYQTGWLLVTDLDIGAPAYQPRVQTKTFPARDVAESAS